MASSLSTLFYGHGIRIGGFLTTRTTARRTAAAVAAAAAAARIFFLMSGGIPIIFIMSIILVVGDVIMPLVASHRDKDETKVGVKEEGRDGCREEGDKGTIRILLPATRTFGVIIFIFVFDTTVVIKKPGSAGLGVSQGHYDLHHPHPHKP